MVFSNENHAIEQTNNVTSEDIVILNAFSDVLAIALHVEKSINLLRYPEKKKSSRRKLSVMVGKKVGAMNSYLIKKYSNYYLFSLYSSF